MDSNIEKMVRSVESDLVMSVWCVSRRYSARCESPIEVMLYQAFVLRHFLDFASWPYVGLGDESELHMKPQVQLFDYRVDFLLTSKHLKYGLVIECDGHDFHERTKEQAARDKSRDRYLTQRGFVVIRFTGAEIWRDPMECASEIMSQLHSAEQRERES